MTDDEKWLREVRRKKRFAELQEEWGLEIGAVLDLCELERQLRREFLWRLDGIWRSVERDVEHADATGKTVWSFGHDPDEEHELVEVVRSFGLPVLDSGDPT